MKQLPPYNDNKMVVAYYRYSSASQNEASIGQQREMVRCWADSEGLEVVQEYYDAAMRGTTADKPGYQRCWRSCQQSLAYVAAWKNDRLVRDYVELVLLEDEASIGSFYKNTPKPR